MFRKTVFLGTGATAGSFLYQDHKAKQGKEEKENKEDKEYKEDKEEKLTKKINHIKQEAARSLKSLANLLDNTTIKIEKPKEEKADIEHQRKPRK